MALSLHPDRLKRYTDIARLLFLYKYGRSDLVTRAGLDDALVGDDLVPPAGDSGPEELAADLERLGPAFGQLLPTRADLLPPAVDEPALRRDVQELVAGYQDVSLEQLQVGRVVLEISHAAGQHGIRLPPELTLLGKTLLNLDQAGRTLAPDFDVNAALREEAASLMQQRMRQSVSPANLFAAALETKEFVEQLPGRVNKLLDAFTNNEVTLKIEVIDEGAVIHGLQKVANRITLGLLLASLIIGAAMLMRVDTTFHLFGYPGFAMVFFLVAAGGGIWLAFNIITSDRPPRKR